MCVRQGTKEASPLIITVCLDGHFRCEASNIIDVVDVVLRLIETKTQRNAYVCEYNCAYHLKFNIVCMTASVCACDQQPEMSLAYVAIYHTY